jgi:hypothetical protein
MDSSQIWGMVSVLCYALGAFFVGWGFWPPYDKFTVKKKKTMRAGRVLDETRLELVEEGVSEAEVTEEVRRIYNGNDLKIFRILLKKSKDMARLRKFGCIGTGLILLGCVFNGITILSQ